MADLPWYKYFPTLFDSDTALLSNQAVGGWQRLLNYMYPKKIDTIKGELDYFARLLRCTDGEAWDIIDELKQQEICNISLHQLDKNHTIVTLTSRKILKENKNRENNKIRQQRRRQKIASNGKVTPSVTGEKLEVRYIEDRKKKKIYIDFAELWNKTITHKSIPKIASPNNLSTKRKKKIKERLKFNNDFGYWEAIFKKIQTLAYYCGNNDTGWTVSFDYIIRDDEKHVAIFEKPLPPKKELKLAQ